MIQLQWLSRLLIPKQPSYQCKIRRWTTQYISSYTDWHSYSNTSSDVENPLHSQILKTDQLQNTKLMNAYHPSTSGNRRDAGSDAAQPSTSGSISGQDHTSDS